MEKKILDSTQIEFQSLSSVDPSGRVFMMGGEIYRGISDTKSNFFLELLQSEPITKLVKDKILVHTERTDYCLEGYSLILKHYRVPFISYPHEWCDVMLRDAALVYLDLNIYLERYGLICYDPRNLNILFDGSQPVYVDFAAIQQKNIEDRHQDLDSLRKRFSANFLLPLSAISQGYASLIRIWMRERYFFKSKTVIDEYLAFGSSPSIKNLLAFYKSKLWLSLRQTLPKRTRILVKPFLKRLKRSKQARTSQISFFEELKLQIESLSLSAPTGTEKDQLSQSSDLLSSMQGKDPKLSILSSLDFLTVLYTESTNISYIQATASLGCKVIAFDSSELNVRNLYLSCKQTKHYVLPLVIDWTASNFDYHNDFVDPIGKRLACDLVICLDFVKQVVTKQNTNLSFERAIKRLWSLSRQWLLVEYFSCDLLEQFIPIQDSYSRAWWEQNNWPDLEDFLELFNPYFRCINIQHLESSSSSLVLLEKK